MADPFATNSSPEFTATELATYDRYFNICDPSNQRFVAPKEAVAFLSKSHLPQEILSKIWNMSDVEQKGFLDRPAFYRAMKLVAVAQLRGTVTESSLHSGI